MHHIRRDTAEGNTLAYKLTAATQTAYANGYPGLLTAYTTGADIPATAGQYLGMYELDAKTNASSSSPLKFSKPPTSKRQPNRVGGASAPPFIKMEVTK